MRPSCPPCWPAAGILGTAQPEALCLFPLTHWAEAFCGEFAVGPLSKNKSTPSQLNGSGCHTQLHWDGPRHPPLLWQRWEEPASRNPGSRKLHETQSTDKTRLQIDPDMGSHQESATKFPSCQNSSMCTGWERGGLRTPILQETVVTGGGDEWTLVNLIFRCSRPQKSPDADTTVSCSSSPGVCAGAADGRQPSWHRG